MDNLERLKLRTGSEDEAVLNDCLESAKAAILSRRYPWGGYPTETVDNGDGTYTTQTVLESMYEDLQFRCALDLYNKIGAEGQLSHSENGISRGYESAWISEQLLREVTPYAGVPL